MRTGVTESACNTLAAAHVLQAEGHEVCTQERASRTQKCPATHLRQPGGSPRRLARRAGLARSAARPGLQLAQRKGASVVRLPHSGGGRGEPRRAQHTAHRANRSESVSRRRLPAIHSRMYERSAADDKRDAPCAGTRGANAPQPLPHRPASAVSEKTPAPSTPRTKE